MWPILDDLFGIRMVAAERLDAMRQTVLKPSKPGAGYRDRDPIEFTLRRQ